MFPSRGPGAGELTEVFCSVATRTTSLPGELSPFERGITGSKDFRHGNLLDIFHGGYEKGGYAAKLIDVAGMEHAVCKEKELSEALMFIDSPLVQKK